MPRGMLFNMNIGLLILTLAECCVTQELSIERKHAPEADFRDLSSEAILNDLSQRGLDPLKPNASAESASIRKAFVEYDSQTTGGHNLNAVDSAQTTKTFNRALEKAGLSTHVRAHTSNPGARVKLRLIGNEDELAIPQLTNDAEETIPIGLYVIWAERRGTKSSKPEPFRLIAPEIMVDIEEAPQ